MTLFTRLGPIEQTTTSPRAFRERAGLLQRVAVRLAYLKRQIRFLDPGCIFVNPQNGVFTRHLFH